MEEGSKSSEKRVIFIPPYINLKPFVATTFSQVSLSLNSISLPQLRPPTPLSFPSALFHPHRRSSTRRRLPLPLRSNPLHLSLSDPHTTPPLSLRSVARVVAPRSSSAQPHAAASGRCSALSSSLFAGHWRVVAPTAATNKFADSRAFGHCPRDRVLGSNLGNLTL